MTEKSIESGKFTISCFFGDRHFVCQCAGARGAFWEILGHTRDFQPISDEPVGTPRQLSLLFQSWTGWKRCSSAGFLRFFRESRRPILYLYVWKDSPRREDKGTYN